MMREAALVTIPGVVTSFPTWRPDMIKRRVHPDDLAHATGIVAVAALGVSFVALLAGLSVISAPEAPAGPFISESEISLETTVG
jgi:hypothetical protein